VSCSYNNYYVIPVLVVDGTSRACRYYAAVTSFAGFLYEIGTPPPRFWSFPSTIKSRRGAEIWEGVLLIFHAGALIKLVMGLQKVVIVFASRGEKKKETPITFRITPRAWPAANDDNCRLNKSETGLRDDAPWERGARAMR
jgi:hypothetical protein